MSERITYDYSNTSNRDFGMPVMETTEDSPIRTYREEVREVLALAEHMPHDVADFLNQLAHADHQTIVGAYVVMKARELAKRYSTL